MFFRSVCRSFNRALFPYSSLGRAKNGTDIFRKLSTTYRKHVAIVLRARKLDNITGHHKLCTQPELNLKNIKNVYCNELSMEDIGSHVQVRGTAMYIKRGRYVVLRDKTGSVRLVIDRKREDLKEWLEKLEEYSLLKVIGIVREKPKLVSNGENSSGKEPFDINISYIISTSPPQKKKSKKNIPVQEQEPKIATDKNTVTCDLINKDMIGKNVHVFGFIKSIDKEGNSFVLCDSNGSVTVTSCNSDFVISKDSFPEVKELKPGELVVVEGLITDAALPWTQHEKKEDCIRLSANFVRKLNAEMFLELKAPDVNRYTVRSHNCGELNATYVGQKVRLMGWVTFLRMNRFLLLQDKYGLVQLTIPDRAQALQNLVANLSLESVISVDGIVCIRPPGNENKLMKTGEIEINVLDLTIINKTENLPFYLKDKRPARPTQLEYRYLDMRQSPNVRRNLEFRSEMLHKMRRFLIETVGFLEIETPTLSRRSSGGAQEFIVPTRKKGEFYALVQSPQHFKQLLMVGGIDRYFQIARCYRDEDGQKDRQPEFTQLDIEMSFCNRDGVIQLMEEVIKYIWPKNFHSLVFPFPRMTYEVAMASYGTDKPDVRFEWKIQNLTDIFLQAGKSCSEVINMEMYMELEDFTALSLVARGGMPAYPVIKQVAEELAMSENCKIFAFNVSTLNKLDTALNKLFLQPIPDVFRRFVNCESEDVVFLGFGPKKNLFKVFGQLRSLSGKRVQEHGVDVYDKNRPFSFLWIVDFPLFEEVDGVTHSVHHPFTKPHPDDEKLLETDPLKVRSLSYDLVLNGNEIGGGSIRIQDAKVQKKIIENILKLDASHFQHMIKGLSYGAPSHGGFALGIDRFIGLLCGSTSIVDVIAFPKYSSGRDPLSGAPTDIFKEDKNLYHIQ